MATKAKTREPRSLKARDIAKLGAALTFRIKERDEKLGTIDPRFRGDDKLDCARGKSAA